MPAWVPNLISATRLALLPVFVLVARSAPVDMARGASPGEARWPALAVFVLIGASDLVDGYLARRFGLQSQTGAVLDAVADKLAQLVVLATLVWSPGPPFADVPSWLLALVVGRDLLLSVSWLTFVALGRPVRVIHRPHGKISSALLFALLVVALLGAPDGAVSAFAIVVAAMIAGSTVQYLRDGWERRQRVRP